MAKKPRFSSFVDTVYVNDALNICYLAAKACYHGEISTVTESKAKFISARIRDGHESISEHSNIIMLLVIKRNKYEDLIEVTASHGYRYLNSAVRIVDGNYIILLGGSIRGYKNLIKEVNKQNRIVYLILRNLIRSCPSEFLVDLYEQGFYKSYEEAYTYGTYTNRPCIDQNYGTVCFNDYFETDDIDIVNVDPIMKIYEDVSKYGFNILEVMDMCTVTIEFRNMSRIITQQLTRHRNAITQESLRYVDATNLSLINPINFKPDQYEGVEVKLNLFGKEFFDGDIKEVAPALEKMYKMIYSQLREQYGMLKEDARSFLPMGTSSRLFVTFTFSNLVHFITLRTHPSAQAEIRSYAERIKTFLDDYFKFILEEAKCSSLVDLDNINKVDFYNNDDSIDSEIILEAIGRPREVIEDINKTAVPPEDPNEEMQDFGMTGAEAKPVDTSEKAVESLYNMYNSEKYADTRIDEDK